jgi:hypothetical protein
MRCGIKGMSNRPPRANFGIFGSTRRNSGASLCTAIFNMRVDPLETRFELGRIPNLDSYLSRAPGRVGDRSAQASKSSSS